MVQEPIIKSRVRKRQMSITHSQMLTRTSKIINLFAHSSHKQRRKFKFKSFLIFFNNRLFGDVETIQEFSDILILYCRTLLNECS